MRTLLIVIDPPGFDLSSCITQTGKPVRIQTFIAQSPVEAFYIGILHRLARLDELQPHSAFFAPGRQCSLAKFRPVVEDNGFWQSSLAGDPIQHPGALAVRPAMCPPRSPGIPACNHPRWSTSESLSRCSRNPSRNPSTSVRSTDSPAASLPHHSSGSAAAVEFSSPILLRDTAGTHAYGSPPFRGVSVHPGVIAMRRSSQPRQPAGVPFAHLVLHFDVTHGCPKSRRHYQFSESTSFSARLSSVSSATTCFSFRFSSSSCFIFFASPLSIPPYFAFQR